jgi:glycerophosphoryl diester phosphodiesterase
VFGNDRAMRWNTLNGTPPRIIAHRGASGYRPEHTLEGYALAATMGTDVIEPDLVASRDGVLYARHDVGLAHSTDIGTRAEYDSRARAIDGVRDWWISDFDAHEIDGLRAVQPIPERGTQYDGRFGVPRFAQLLDLGQQVNASRSVPLIIDAEFKDPAFFSAQGIDVLAALMRDLEPRGLIGMQAPVWLESFDHEFLHRAHQRCGNLCFALLEHAPDAVALREFATWVRGIAPAKNLLWDKAGRDSGLVAAAHAHGLEAHAWTFREDHSPAPFATPRAELEAAFALGVDALFCDFPDCAVKYRATFAANA